MEQIQNDICILKNKIEFQKNLWFPDIIVGLTRGGLIPAVYLSHALKVPMITCEWSLRDNIQSKKEFPFTQIAEGSRVLIVDDIIDSGATIADIKSEIEGVVDHRVATLWQNIACPVQAEYFASALNRNTDTRWVIFDWETF